MKKKFLIGTLITSVGLLGILTLNAAGNRIQIVSENDSVKTLSSDGASILNTINTETSDLVNGEVNIEIILNNSKNTEIMYAIDNSSVVSGIKNNVIDSIKTNAKTVSNMDNLKQGVAYTTKNGSEDAVSVVELDTKGIDTALENIKTAESGKDGAIFDAIDQAAEKFSTSNVDNKVLVVYTGSLGTLTTEQLSALKTKMEGLKTKGIKVIAYGIDLGDATNFNAIFESAVKHEVSAANISTGLNFTTDLAAYLPSAKQNVKGNVTFDSYILNNFEIKNVATTTGTASYDSTNNQVVWTPGNIGINQVEKLTYTLSLKSVVDESIVDKINMRTNRQIKISGDGGNGVSFDDSYPKDSTVDDEICSPTIRILKEAVDNPKTGIENYMIAGICMIAVGAVTLLVLNRKTKFSRI